MSAVEEKIFNSKIYENIIEKIKEIDTPDSDVNYKEGTSFETIEKQKVYLWIRLFLEEDEEGNLSDLVPNDDLLMEYKWAPGEKIMTKFACYGKQGVQKDHENEIIGYNPEDDKRVVCLLADSDIINYSDEVPFLRRLFKGSFHYQEEIVKRQDLTFTNQRTNEVVRYFDIDI